MMGTPDVWVRVNSVTFGSRMVRADTVEQVRWDGKTPQHLILTLHGGDEVRQDVRPGEPIGDMDDTEGPDLAEHLVSAIARAADRPGGHMLDLKRDENTGAVGWFRTPLVDKPWAG
ncbi:hypothetical protein TPA0910_80950 [Streptomyces hygroscopicus subsp. sporocinereus]|uniref:Uncharacterized protein n=2 Tax=Streptomyces hygroscopicus TaxID=1912 RepID=A0ABQ3UDI0_STRHY|nr:hypothetical protein TPA0910_80950 [Streptomyces hygroscopicus]